MKDEQKAEVGGAPERETPLERAYRLGEGCGGLDAAGVKRLVEISRQNEVAPAPRELRVTRKNDVLVDEPVVTVGFPEDF